MSARHPTMVRNNTCGNRDVRGDDAKRAQNIVVASLFLALRYSIEDCAGRLK
jgi:hypothetical protein